MWLRVVIVVDVVVGVVIIVCDGDDVVVAVAEFMLTWVSADVVHVVLL